MPPIKHTQLFDFPAYNAAIKEAKQSSEEFGKTMEVTIGRLQQEQKQLNAALKEYASILKTFNTSQAGASDALKRYNKEIDDNIAGITELKALQKGLAQVVDTSKASVAQLEAELKGLTAQYKNLKPGAAGYNEEVDRINKRIKEIVPNVNAFNQALKNAKQSADQAEGSYKQMQTQLGNLRNQLRNLPGAFDPVTGKLNKANKEAVGLMKEITRLDGALKQADRTMGIFVRNVGNYESAFKGLGRGLLTTVGQIVGIQSAFEAVSFSFRSNLEFDSLNAALKLVSGSTQEFAINQSFLRRTADDLGLEIVGLTKNFKNFFAAATTAGLGAQQTRDIFQQVSRVGASLKLSQDDLNGVFTAFGQIISKGRVQAEELRGQIGERLPGAFAVAAKAIGVTQAELNQLLQKGEVVASDFLPKFAAELEKTFGGGTERVEGLQAAVNRFNNALKDIVTDENGGLNRFFTSIINFFTDSLKGAEKFFQFVFDKIDPAAAKVRELGDAYGDAYNEGITKSVQELKQAIVENNEEYLKYIKRVKEFEKTQDEALERQKEITAIQKERVRGLRDALKQKQSPLLAVGPTGNPEDDAKARAKQEKAFEDGIRRQQAYLEKLAQLQQQENELAFVRGEKSEMAFQQRKLEITGEYAGKAAELEQQLGEKADQARLTDLKKRFVDAQVEFEKFIEKSSPKAAQVGGITPDATARGANIDTTKALDSGFVDAYAASLDAYEQYWEERNRIAEENAEREKEILQGIIDTSSELAFSALDLIASSQDARFEERISKLEEEKARELEIAGTNAAARERIEFEYNRKIAKEKQKQARAQKTASLFEIAINTATGISRTIANLGLPAALPFVAIAAAQGLIQAAVVAARPLPQFRKGTNNAPEGPAIINEEGFEFVEKNGRLKVYEGKNRVVNLEGGEKIHTHTESKKMLERFFRAAELRNEITAGVGVADRLRAGRAEEQVAITARAMERGMNLNQLGDSIRGTLKEIPVNQTIYDERGIVKRQKQLNQTITYLNAQHSI